MRILTNLKGWTNGGPLVKLVKGEGRATRARSLALPRLAAPWAWRGVSSRVETVTVTVSIWVIFWKVCFAESCLECCYHQSILLYLPLQLLFTALG
jgi:hypothetical protein